MTTEIRSPRRSLSAPHALGSFLCAMVLVSANACAGSDGSARDASELSAPDRSARIGELQDAIARDHATLQALVSRPREEVETPLHSDPTLHAIARRLGDQERELAHLLAAEAATD
jgi:hypothetical protein